MSDNLEQTTPEEVTTEVPETEAQTQVEQEVPAGLGEPLWYESLPEDLKTNQNITKFKTLKDFAAWQSNASKLIGKKVSELQAEEIKQFLSPEEIVSIAQERGMPKSVDEYAVRSLDELPDKEMATNIKQLAMEQGITPTQMESLLELNSKLASENIEKQKAQWMDELKTTYGTGLAKEMELAASAAKQYCSPELMQTLHNAGMGHNPDIIKAFAKVAREMLPDDIPRGSPADVDHKQAVQKEIQSLISNPEFYNRWKRGDPKAAGELNALYQKLEN